MKPWTLAYMEVVYRANCFKLAWEEAQWQFAHYSWQRPNLVKARMFLECALAIYRVESIKENSNG